MKKSQTTRTSGTGGNARKTTSFFDILKQHQSDLKRSIFQLGTKNEELVREQYNYMDNLFEKGPSPELIEHQQSFQQSTYLNQSQEDFQRKPGLSKSNYETYEDINDCKGAARRRTPNNFSPSRSFLNDESSEDEPEYSGMSYPSTISFYDVTRNAMSRGEISKSKTVSFGGKRTCGDDKRCLLENVADSHLSKQPSKSILKQPSTNFEVKTNVEQSSDEASFFSRMNFSLIDSSVFKRARNALEPTIKSLF